MGHRRLVALLAGLTLLGGAVAPTAGTAKTKAPSARVVAACAAHKARAHERCLRGRAALRHVSGRGRVRRPVARGPMVVGPPAGGAPTPVGAGVSGADGAGGVAGATPAPAGPVALPVASTVGAEAYDFGTFVLRLTRYVVPAGTLTIYFRNYDSSEHNLWLDPPQSGAAPVQISAAVGENAGATKTVPVTAGTWRMYCAIAGHSSMTRDLAVV